MERAGAKIAFAACALLASCVAYDSPPPKKASSDTTSPAISLKLKSMPKCDHEDPADPFLHNLLDWSRNDLAVTLRLRVNAAGTVDEVTVTTYAPSNDRLAARWANSLARCWHSALFDTSVSTRIAFPAYYDVKETFKTRRNALGNIKE